MQTDTFTSFIEALRHRRGMYLPDHEDCYAQVVAAILGFDCATMGGALAGFREWLVVKFNGMSNLSWEGIIDMVLRKAKITDTEQRTVFLLDLIDEYLADRRERRVEAFIGAYHDWMGARGYRRY